MFQSSVMSIERFTTRHNQPDQCIKARNLPKNYDHLAILLLFEKIAKIRCYNRTSDTLWIRFQNIKDRKACLILDGYAIGTKRMQIILNFKDEEVPVSAWAAMHGISTEDKYKLSFRNVVEERGEEKKLVRKKSEVIQTMDAKVEQTLRYVFSRRYFNLLILLYLVSIVVSLAVRGRD